MPAILRIAGIFLLQLATLLVGTRLIGSPIMSATIWRDPLGSCSGYDVDLRFMIGLSAASLLLGGFLAVKSCRQSTFWTFIASLAILNIVFATHIKIPSPCF